MSERCARTPHEQPYKRSLEQEKNLSGLNRFRPHERLRSSSDFLRVKRIGQRFRSPHFGVNCAENGFAFHRLGMVVQKRFWPAVGRNLVKRRLREWFRLHKWVLPLPGKDIVVIARPGAESLSFNDMTKELLAVFLKRDDRSV